MYTRGCCGYKSKQRDILKRHLFGHDKARMPLGCPDGALDITMGRDPALRMPGQCFGHVHGQRTRIGGGHRRCFGDGGCGHEKQFLRGVRTPICKHILGKRSKNPYMQAYLVKYINSEFMHMRYACIHVAVAVQMQTS